MKMSCKFRVPETKDKPTNNEILDWVAYHVGACCTLSGENPLIEEEFEAECFSVEVYE